MNSKKLSDQASWLKTIGIEYYCSTKDIASTTCDNEGKNATKSIIDPNINKKSPLNQINVRMDSNDSLKAQAMAQDLADKANTLADLQEAVNNFTGCELKQFAKRTVFSDGVPTAPIMLIGEAPGATEDMQGISFCGESGKLLDNILSSIAISRKVNAYLTNTVFWRPPANRQPTPAEIDICRPFVEKHIALINPKIIILVGSTAATSLLGKHAGITKIRREYYQYINKYLSTPIITTAIFHPAYLLRQPMQKKTIWYDLLNIKSFLEQENIR